MAEHEELDEVSASDPEARSRTWSMRATVIVVVIVVFAGVLGAKFIPQMASSRTAPVASVTSARNDASADYAAASKSGKPVYILFHSLS